MRSGKRCSLCNSYKENLVEDPSGGIESVLEGVGGSGYENNIRRVARSERRRDNEEHRRKIWISLYPM